MIFQKTHTNPKTLKPDLKLISLEDQKHAFSENLLHSADDPAFIKSNDC